MANRSKRFRDLLTDHSNLILTRGSGESLIIGDGDEAIVITAYDCTPGRVKFGILAPRHVPIRRAEIGPFIPPEPVAATK